MWEHSLFFGLTICVAYKSWLLQLMPLTHFGIAAHSCKVPVFDTFGGFDDGVHNGGFIGFSNLGEKFSSKEVKVSIFKWKSCTYHNFQVPRGSVSSSKGFVQQAWINWIWGENKPKWGKPTFDLLYCLAVECGILFFFFPFYEFFEALVVLQAWIHWRSRGQQTSLRLTHFVIILFFSSSFWGFYLSL